MAEPAHSQKNLSAPESRPPHWILLRLVATPGDVLCATISMLAAVSATAGFVGPSLRVHSVPARSAACVMEEAPSALVLKHAPVQTAYLPHV